MNPDFTWMIAKRMVCFAMRPFFDCSILGYMTLYPYYRQKSSLPINLAPLGYLQLFMITPYLADCNKYDLLAERHYYMIVQSMNISLCDLCNLRL